VRSTLPPFSLVDERVADFISLLCSFQSNTRLILGPQGGSTIVQDTRMLNDLRDLSVTDDNGTRVLRLRFKTGDPLDLVTDGELVPLLREFSWILTSNLSSSRSTSARDGEFTGLLVEHRIESLILFLSSFSFQMISANLSNPAPRTKAAAPDMTAVRVTLSGLLNLVAMKSEVRSAALGVLATGTFLPPFAFPFHLSAH